MERRGGNRVEYFYDENGVPLYMIRYYVNVGFTQLNFFVTNLQGDVIAVCDNTNVPRFFYHYDAWGKLLSVTNANGEDVTGVSNAASWNILRYRGYIYDQETRLYYLNSRYYDPETGRMISPDALGVLTVSLTALTDKNLYAYCDNNPVVRADGNGEFWHIVIGAAIGAVIGAVSSVVAQAVSGQEINWAEVGVSAVSGAISGAVSAACPAMGAVATGFVQGTISAGTYVATELVNGRTPTVIGTLAAGVTSGILAGGIKAISNKLTTTKLYRSVSPAEANNFSSTGKLSTGEGQMEGKFFATSRNDAQIWGKKLGNSNIISIRVPKSALLHSSVTYFPRLDAIGPAYYFSDLVYLNSVLR